MEIEKPPVFNKWNAWYKLVLIALVAQIIFFLLLTNYFA